MPPSTNLATLAAGNTMVFSDRILASANRNVTTDFAAPALDIPTFRRKFGLAVGETAADVGTIDHDSNVVYNAGGTSLSAGIVTGSFALVASALDYWADIHETGVTADAYLTQPVGARTLDFGKKTVKDLSAYNNPDGINGILAWTAVPIEDPNDALSEGEPLTMFRSSEYREYARIDIGNAIAAIEGQIAIQYLLDRGIFDIIDSNDNGLITAPELQTFVDTAATIGLPEAGAMARLLGGTARIDFAGRTFYGEQADQPDVLQRRFNFFDFAGDGQLNGMITIDQFKLLAHNLLPLPDQYVIIDRQRASANGFLLDPEADRNFKELQHIKPTYQFVPKSVVKRYHDISPGIFGVNRGQSPLRSSPFYAAFDHKTRRKTVRAKPEAPAKPPVTPAGGRQRDATTPPRRRRPRRRRPHQAGRQPGRTTPRCPRLNRARRRETTATAPKSPEQQQADLIQAVKDLIPKPASSEGEPTTAKATTRLEGDRCVPSRGDIGGSTAGPEVGVEGIGTGPDRTAQARAQQDSGRVTPAIESTPQEKDITKVDKVYDSNEPRKWRGGASSRVKLTPPRPPEPGN